MISLNTLMLIVFVSHLSLSSTTRCLRNLKKFWWGEFELYSKEIPICGNINDDYRQESCGVCGRPTYKSSSTYTCWFIYTQRYFQLPDVENKVHSCDFVNHCERYDKPETCVNCRSGFTSYKCGCPHTLYGRDCEKSIFVKGTEKSYANGIDVLYPAKVRVSNMMTVLVAVENIGDNIEIEITGLLGLRQNKFRKTITRARYVDQNRIGSLHTYCENAIPLNMETCKKLLVGTHSLFTTDIWFPLIRRTDHLAYYADPHSPNPAEPDDYPIGYQTTFHVTVKNTPALTGKQETVFTNSYELFVQYPSNIKCYKDIEIANCPSGDTEKVLFPRFSETFAGRLPSYSIIAPTFGNTCLETKNSKRWVILREDEFGEVKVIRNGSGNIFQIDQYELRKGLHTLQYIYTTIMADEGPTENFASCTLIVQAEELEAVISGGDEISVDLEQSFVLNGTESSDPNVEDQYHGLMFEWSCEMVHDSSKCLVDYLSPSVLGNYQSEITIPAFALDINRRYRVKLKVWKKNMTSAVAYQVIHAISNLSASVKCLGINCQYNKGKWFVDSEQDVYLKGTVKVGEKVKKVINPSDLDYIWTYSTDNGSTFEPVNNISLSISSKDILRIDGSKLKQGKFYKFKLEIPGTEAIAEFGLTVIKALEQECYVEPNNGIVGLTLFNFTCTLLSNMIKVYELYDKSGDDLPLLFSGRMLGTRDRSEKFENFRLTSGIVIAYFYYIHRKSHMKKRIDVKLTPFRGVRKDVENIANFGAFFLEQNYERVLNTASVVPVVLTPEMSKVAIKDLSSYIYRVVDKYINDLNRNIMRKNSNVSHFPLENTKLSLSTITFVVKEISASKPFILEPIVFKEITSILIKLTNNLKNCLKNIANEPTLTYRILLDMLQSIINTVEILLATKTSEVYFKPLYLVNEVLLETLQEALRELVDVLYLVSSIQLQYIYMASRAGDFLLQENGGLSKVESNKSNIIGFAQIDFGESTGDINNTGTWRVSPEIPIKLPNNTLKVLKTRKKGRLSAIQVAKIMINPFWWGSDNINTNVLLFKICFLSSYECQQQRKLSKSLVGFYFNITETVLSINAIEGYATQVNSTNTTTDYDLDLEVTVYRFDPPVKARMLIEFEFSNGNEEFKVLVVENMRPTFKMMNEDATIVSASKPIYNKLQYRNIEKDKLYYMGILPVKSAVKFKVKVYYTLCKTWLEFSWGSFGCFVGNETNDNQLQCNCDHFSLFGGLVQVPPYSQNPATDYKLFLTEVINWIPLVLLVITIVLFILLCIWGRIKDKRDLKKGVVTLLQDNYPGERYAYLIGVYTGSRFRSSTDANVGIKLFGQRSYSRPHILKSNLYNIMQKNSDDWFLMFCPHHLGTIELLQLWHDNSGKSPDWFVEKIVVFDLTENFEYLFEIDMWIALEANEYPEAEVTPVSVEEFFSVRKVFRDNIIFGFRDTHYWTSILWKHPRNPVSRVKRASVLMCFALVAMSCSLIFCLYFKGDVKEDDTTFSFIQNDLITFLFAFLTASFVSYLVMFLHRKSFTYGYMPSTSSLFLRQDDSDKISMISETLSGTSVTDSLYSSRKTKNLEISDKVLRNKFLKFDTQNQKVKRKSRSERLTNVLRSVVKGSSLEPVRLPKYKPTLKVNKRYLITAWIFVFTLIIVSSVIVIVFGWKLTNIKSQKWIVIFILIILFDAVILSTLRVLIFSAILSFVFQRLLSTPNYQVKSKDGQQKHLVGNLDHLYKLLAIRSQPKYCPLYGKLQEEYRLKRVKRLYWKSVLDFAIVIFFIFVLYMVTSLSIKTHFLTNSHSAFMLSRDHVPRIHSFVDIFNRSHYEMFGIRGLPRQLYRSMWYNEFSLDDSNQLREIYWTDDYVYKTFGSPRVRQVRIGIGNCPTVNNVEVGEYCNLPWSSSNEDKDVYQTSWSVGGWGDVERKTTAWKYTDLENSNSSEVYGPTRTLYHSGGYFENMGFTKDNIVELFSYFKRSNWLDHMTKAVFVEITLYNVNTQLFSQVVLVAEQLPSGQYLTAVSVDSVTTNFRLDPWRVSFAVFLIFFFVRVCLYMNRNGLFVYLSKPTHVFEVFLIALGIVTIVLYIVHVIGASHYVQHFQKRGEYEYFNFSRTISLVSSTRNIMCVLFGLVVVRLLISWRFGRIYFTFYYTLLLSWPWIVWLTLYFIIAMLLAWRIIGYLLNVFIFSFSENNVLLYYKDFYSGENHNFPHKVLMFLMSVLNYTVVLIFIGSFSYYYRVSKDYRLIDTDNLNMFTFLKSEIKDWIKKRKSRVYIKKVTK